MTFKIDSFMAPGYPGNDAEAQTVPASTVEDQRGAKPEYGIQPAMWMIVFFVLAFVGLYLFLED